MIDGNQLDDAVRRIALTADGKLFHTLLSRALMATCPTPHIPGALPLHEGRRSFAAHLKGLMDSALAESSTGDRSTESSSERPIVVAAASGSSARARSRGAARRGGIGYDTEPGK